MVLFFLKTKQDAYITAHNEKESLHLALKNRQVTTKTLQAT